MARSSVKKEQKYNTSYEHSYQSCIFCVVIIICALLLFNGCKTVTQYQKEYVYSTDTLYQKVLQKDSIYLMDSVYVKEKGDTFYYERWHTKYIEKMLHDTIYKSKTDSVYIDVLKEKDLSKKERVGMFISDIGSFLLFVAFLWVLWKVCKIIRSS